MVPLATKPSIPTLRVLMILGGDGLVAARHLFHYGYQPTIFYPKPTNNEIYQRLANQLRNLNIPFTEDFEASLKNTNHVVDSIFGRPTYVLPI